MLKFCYITAKALLLSWVLTEHYYTQFIYLLSAAMLAY